MAGFRGLFVRKGSTGTQPVDARKALAGLLAPASTLGARQGILAGPGDPLRVTGTAGWTYRVAAGPLVTSRSAADGAVLWGNDGAADTPAVAAAPGSGSRYDLIWMRHQDPDAGESDTPEIGVTSGAASGAPVRPAVPAGAVVLAEALVSAGATSTSHANVTITQTLGYTVARGAPVPVRSQTERDALTTYNGLTVDRLDLGRLQRHNGTAWRDITSTGRLESFGFSNSQTDASGYVVKSHGLGVTPTHVFVTLAKAVTEDITRLQEVVVDTFDSGNISFRAYRRDTNLPFGGNAVAFYWHAVVQQ